MRTGGFFLGLGVGCFSGRSVIYGGRESEVCGRGFVFMMFWGGIVWGFLGGGARRKFNRFLKLIEIVI